MLIDPPELSAEHVDDALRAARQSMAATIPDLETPTAVMRAAEVLDTLQQLGHLAPALSYLLRSQRQAISE